MVGDFKVVTLCGSVWFRDEIWKECKRLTLGGQIVITPGVFTDTEVMLEKDYAMISDMNMRKIDMADSIHIINKDGYFGDRVKREIAYAIFARKPITLMNDDNESVSTLKKIKDDCTQLILSSKCRLGLQGEDDYWAGLSDMVFERYGFHLGKMPDIEFYGFNCFQDL